jgi:hypothetical protein
MPSPRTVTFLKDIGWLLLAGALIPVAMALTLGAGLAIVARHLYWWGRGNTTPTSRVPRDGSPMRP